MKARDDDTDHADGAAGFAVVDPVNPGRFVFASPHSGGVYPADMGADPALSEASLRSAEDALVDQLIAPGADGGAALVLGRLGRAYVDLNRDPDDLDPLLIEGLEGAGSARTAAGYGVIPRLSGDGRALYARRLRLDEARERITRVHAPYHAALAQRMEAARARHGQAVPVDWPSMPARAARGRGRGAGTRCGAGRPARLVLRR